ncbi:hypothetical protein ACFE04_016081 [Oxalis oulophora]
MSTSKKIDASIASSAVVDYDSWTSNPTAEKWKKQRVRNYDKLVEFFAPDRATSEHAETASEMRQRRANESTTAIIESSTSKKISIHVAEMWTLVVELRLESPQSTDAYVYLTQKPEMLTALLDCPIEVRKDVLLQMMDNGNRQRL